MLYKAIELPIYILLSLYINYIGTIVYKPRKKITKTKIISMLVLIILLILLSNHFNKIYLIFNYYLLCITYYKITYKKNTHLALYSTLITIITISISKLLLLIFNIQKFNEILLIILAFFLASIFRKTINILINSTFNITLLNYLLLSIYLIYTISTLSFNKQVIQDIVIYILLLTLLIIIIIQEQKIEKLKRKNKEFQKYSKMGEQVITRYRKIAHEYKNKLIIIKSMINPPNKELIKYVDYLIDEPVLIKNKWLNELKFIPFPEIKNFLNYKINILEQNKAEIELFIGEELANINPEKVNLIAINNLNTIIGVMLDNMIESIEQTTEKLVSINIYIDKNIVHILLANNVENTIDLTKINKLGYSTKGHKRGIGLSLVSDIIKFTKSLELETKIDEKFFIQHLKIKNIKKYLKK